MANANSLGQLGDSYIRAANPQWDQWSRKRQARVLLSKRRHWASRFPEDKLDLSDYRLPELEDHYPPALLDGESWAQTTEDVCYYAPDGTQIDLRRWATLREGGEASVKRPWLISGLYFRAGVAIRVSTVWLGMNHNFGSGTPLFWETAVFVGGGFMDTAMYRYGSQAAALQGHRDTVTLIRNAQLTRRQLAATSAPRSSSIKRVAAAR